MNEQPPAPPAALDESAQERKIWVKPEIQELDHELTETGGGSSLNYFDGYGYSGPT